jgi:hypothetical protein
VEIEIEGCDPREAEAEVEVEVEVKSVNSSEMRSLASISILSECVKSVNTVHSSIVKEMHDIV